MLPFYKPELVDVDGKTIAEIYDTVSLQAARAFNADGSCTLVIPNRYPRTWFKMHTRMNLWRYDYDGHPHNWGDTVWFLKKLDHDRSEGTYTLSFVDAFAMLKGRLIAYTSQGPYADKTLEEFELITYNSALRADNMMRAYMRENVGALALDERRLIDIITIEEDRDLGAFVEKQASWAELQSTLSDIAKMSSAKGVDLYHDLLPLPGGRFIFRVWSDLRGLDRSTGTDNPLLLTEESGFISDVHEIEDWSEVASFVYVLGFDSAGSQIIVTGENRSLSNLDPFSRLEVTANNNEADANSVLADTALGALRSRRPRRLLTANIVENSALAFGRDIDYGDRVKVQVATSEYQCVVDAITVSWSENQEQLDIRLQGEIVVGNFETSIWTPPEPLPIPENLAPVPDAGGDQTIGFGMAAIMHGSATDDGLPYPPGALTNTWSQTYGPGTALFGDVHNMGTTTTFDAPGDYVIRLTSNDGELEAFDEMTVSVTEEELPENAPPTVDAGPDQVIDFLMAAIMAGDTDDDGLPNPPSSLVKTWTQTSGPGTAIFGSPHSSGTTVTFDAPGVYVLRLTADDGELTAFDEMTVTVNP